MGCKYMLKYERLGLENTIDKFLSIKQKENAKNIRKAVRRKKRKDLKLGERISAIFDLHFRKSFAIDLADLIKSFKTFNTTATIYTLPDDLKRDLECIGAHTTSSTFTELSTAINSALSKSHDSSRIALAHQNNKLLRALKKSKLESKYITYWEDGKAINSSLEAGIIHLGNKKLSALSLAERRGLVLFDTTEAEMIEPPLSDEESCLTELEDMVRKGEIAESEITKNVSEIRIIFRKRRVLDALNSKIWKTICTLQKEKSNGAIDFSEANKILQTIYDRNRREMARCDTYLGKFDFASLVEKVAWVNNKREQEAWTRAHLEALDKVGEVTPRSQQVIEQIKKSNRITMEAKKDLRHLAIQELQSSGELGEMHQHVGHIIVPGAVDEDAHETMIRKKIDEMIAIATQTPEERAVSYLRDMGINTTKSEVSEIPQESAESYREIFKDESYSFDIERIRKIKELIDSQRSAKANSICREYIRYRASLGDKRSALTFSEYARALYLQENMDISMVDEKIMSADIALVAEEVGERVR